MAGSRFEKYGTIFARAHGLMRTGALKESHKPLWFDVYERYPPHVEPRALRPVPEKCLTPILYPEDEIRAKFYKEFPSRTPIDLTGSNSNYKPLSQKFIDKYMELSTSTRLFEETFMKTEEALKAEGISLKFDKRKIQKELRQKDENVADKEFVEDVNDLRESEILYDYSEEPKGEHLKFDLKSVIDDDRKYN